MKEKQKSKGTTMGESFQDRLDNSYQIPSYILDKDLGAQISSDGARSTDRNSEELPVIPLTPDQRYSFDAKGWLLIPGVLTASEIVEMREFVKVLHEDPESLPEYERSSVGGPLQKLTDHPIVVGFAQEFLYQPYTDGGGPSLANENCYGFRQESSFITIRSASGNTPGAKGDGNFAPHNGNGMMRLPGDCHYYQAFPGHAYSALTRIVWEFNEVATGDGGTLLLTGSHKAAFPAPQTVFNAKSDLWDTYSCPEGSVLIFTEALTHSGIQWQNSERKRIAVFNCYNSIHSKWHNWNPPEAVLNAMPDKRKTLYRPVYVSGNFT